MSGFMPFFNKRRSFLKRSFGLLAMVTFNPFRFLAHGTAREMNTLRIIKKSDQFNDVIFGGRFHGNKPVYNGRSNVQPYSSLFYWSNGYVKEPCEFGLHPHQGFEIMTFLFEGTIPHFDTETRVWTSLNAGDFQIIQSNSGIQHQERVSENSRAFQIWFDPNFQESIHLKPSYIDYRASDFLPREEKGIRYLTYIGAGSSAHALTPSLTIKKLTFDRYMTTEIPLNEEMSYTFYVLSGGGEVGGVKIEQDDALRISQASTLALSFEGELFYIETPTELSYQPIWTR